MSKRPRHWYVPLIFLRMVRPIRIGTSGRGRAIYTDILEAIEKAGQLCERSILASTLKTCQNTLKQRKNTVCYPQNDINAMQNAEKQLESDWSCEYAQHFRV